MKIKLTPKNMMNQVYKFYKEHLTPRPPGRKPPNFRHCLMWALATGDYSLDWQFQFQKQISWSAAEATWAIMLNPRKALTWEILLPAAFEDGRRGAERHEPDETWSDDGYSIGDYARLAVQAATMREEANDEAAQAAFDMEDEPDGAADDAQNDGETHEEGPAHLDPMVAIGNYLSGIETPTSDEEEDAASPMRFSDGSPAAGLPVYAAAAADRMARRPRTPSLESNVSMTESERRREASRRRARYVLDDEAEDDDDELESGNSSESSP